LIEQATAIRLTHDGGLSWLLPTFSIAGVTPDQPASELAPTMFDAQNGVLPIQTSTGLYLTRTTDGGLTWSGAQRVSDCPACNGLGLAFLDQRRWIDSSQGLNLTVDGGQTWTKVTTTNPGKTVTGVEVIGNGAAVAFAPGLFASETVDWGAHWKAVALPDIYPTYRGFSSQGGWS